MKSVTTERYWNNHWERTVSEIAPKEHPLREWIEREIPDTTTATCMEIGCYPGKFLAVLGQKGYEVNGIDTFPNVTSLQAWLKRQGYKCGHLYEADFLTFAPSTTYDLVCSFGFIEHFENWSEVLDKHLKLLKTGGKIVIDVPNLCSPIYYFLYKLFEPGTLRNHVLSAMNMQSIVESLKQNGCLIDHSNYVGHFYFRFVSKHDTFHRSIAGFINVFAPLLNLLPDALSKRYIGVIATKT